MQVDLGGVFQEGLTTARLLQRFRNLLTHCALEVLAVVLRQLQGVVDLGEVEGLEPARIEAACDLLEFTAVAAEQSTDGPHAPLLAGALLRFFDEATILLDLEHQTKLYL